MLSLQDTDPCFFSIESIEGFPEPASNITYIDTPGGAQMRYKEPALSGFCNIPGIKSYSGYISMNASVNMYFWFSTTATDCADKPITLWMNGGPGADSLPFRKC